MLRLLTLAYFAVFFGLYLSGADLYLGRVHVIPSPTGVCLLLLIGPTAVLVLRDYLTRDSGSRILFVYRENGPAVGAFVALGAFSLLLSLHPGAYWGQGGKWIYLLVYGFVIFMLSMLLPSYVAVRDHFTGMVRISLYLVCGSIAVDLAAPGTFSNVVARAAGFPENSNFAALATTMVCAGALSYRQNKDRVADWLTLLVAALGVFGTLSRSGMLEFVILLFFYGYSSVVAGGIKGKNILIVLCGAIGFAAILAVSIPLLIEHTEMFSKYRTRVTSIGGSGSVDDGSSDHRVRAVMESLDLVSQSPVVGNGTAHTRMMRELPHNIYLMQWVNNGLGGLLSYLMLLAASFWLFYKRGYRPGQAFVAVSAVGGLFSHNVLDQRPFLILLGTMLGMSLYASKCSKLDEVS